MSPDLTFDESAVEYILEEFDKDIDEEGFIVEADSRERVLTPGGEEVPVSEFGGIAKGSEIFVEDNFASLIDYVKRQKS